MKTNEGFRLPTVELLDWTRRLVELVLGLRYDVVYKLVRIRVDRILSSDARPFMEFRRPEFYSS